jgi:ubiquinone/menaquinone biosynthesis C-methylase UbiE
MNFFTHKTVAERYALYRPYFHPLVIKKIRNHLGVQNLVDRVLDIGCGTGQSTVALKETAHSVIGVDISTDMLQLAERKPGIQYIQSAAEDLGTLESDSFDLLTTSLAFHWFDQNKFFSEANRLLKSKAWLVIYNNGFTGQMNGNTEFNLWFKKVYLTRYSTPPRNSVPLTQESAKELSFQFAHQDEYKNEWQFTAEELSAYLTTQSNVIRATEQGNERVDDVYRWLVTQTTPFFTKQKESFIFEGYIWYLQKES